jgi:hypothetical protein
MADGLPSQDKIRGKLRTFFAMKNPTAKRGVSCKSGFCNKPYYSSLYKLTGCHGREQHDPDYKRWGS